MNKGKATETKAQVFETVANIAATFGSPARLKILYLLAQAPRSVDVIAEITGESIANTSQHLQRLLNEGLVAVKKEKLCRIYRLSDESIALLIEGFFDLAEKISPVMSQIESCLIEADGGKAIPLSSVIEDIEANKAVMLDVREAYESSNSPIAGAILLPLKDLKEKAKTLAKGKIYYIFCRGRACELATEGVKILRDFGLKAYRLKDSPASIRTRVK
jgi:DNA-binding transcriptional ArsR family regulator/rhodanese-related sulfurtransferase